MVPTVLLGPFLFIIKYFASLFCFKSYCYGRKIQIPPPVFPFLGFVF
jgi:hypothetical protein